MPKGHVLSTNEPILCEQKAASASRVCGGYAWLKVSNTGNVHFCAYVCSRCQLHTDTDCPLKAAEAKEPK